MARGRMIDKRVSNSKKLGRASDKAKVLWFMLYPHLDKEGRIAFDDLDDLKTEIIPKFKGWPLRKVGDILNELADIKLIYLYPNKDKIAMQFVRFEDFQVGLRKEREANSKVDPPGVAPENSGVFRITPALSLSLIRSSSVKEGKKELKPKTLTPTSEAAAEVDIKLTQILIDLILKNDPKSPVQDMTNITQKKWLTDCRLLREKNKRTPDEIKFVIGWTQQDSFERTNVLSMPKLRKRFSQLLMKAKRDKGYDKFVTGGKW